MMERLYPLVMAIGVALLLLGCGREPQQNENDVPQPAVLLKEEGVKYAYPHLSADGSRILFQANVTGTWQLYTARRNGTDRRQITSGNYNNMFADWSPDDSKIVFVSDQSGDEEVYVMNSDGSDLLNLSNSQARDIHPYWSTDGRKILFNSSRDDMENGSLDVFEISPDGTGLRQLTQGGDVETCAHFSPSGHQMVFLKMSAITESDDIVVMDLANGQESKITDDRDRDGWPDWAPDGSSIVFSSMYYGSFSLYLIDVNGNNRRRLTAPPTGLQDGRAQFSSDGAEIIFNRDYNDSTIGILTMRLRP